MKRAKLSGKFVSVALGKNWLMEMKRPAPILFCKGGGGGGWVGRKREWTSFTE